MGGVAMTGTRREATPLARLPLLGAMQATADVVLIVAIPMMTHTAAPGRRLRRKAGHRATIHHHHRTPLEAAVAAGGAEEAIPVTGTPLRSPHVQ